MAREALREVAHTRVVFELDLVARVGDGGARRDSVHVAVEGADEPAHERTVRLAREVCALQVGVRSGEEVARCLARRVLARVVVLCNVDELRAARLCAAQVRRQRAEACEVRRHRARSKLLSNNPPTLVERRRVVHARRGVAGGAQADCCRLGVFARIEIELELIIVARSRARKGAPALCDRPASTQARLAAICLEAGAAGSKATINLEAAAAGLWCSACSCSACGDATAHSRATACRRAAIALTARHDGNHAQWRGQAERDELRDERTLADALGWRGEQHARLVALVVHGGVGHVRLREDTCTARARVERHHVLARALEALLLVVPAARAVGAVLRHARKVPKEA